MRARVEKGGLEPGTLRTTDLQQTCMNKDMKNANATSSKTLCQTVTVTFFTMSDVCTGIN